MCVVRITACESFVITACCSPIEKQRDRAQAAQAAAAGGVHQNGRGCGTGDEGCQRAQESPGIRGTLDERQADPEVRILPSGSDRCRERTRAVERHPAEARAARVAESRLLCCIPR